MVRFPDEKRPRNMTPEELAAHRRRLGREASARYYAKNRVELNAKKSAKYAAGDKTKLQQYGRDYYLSNREHLKAQALARYHRLKNEAAATLESVKKISV